jgi:hypothetical protein
VLHGYRAVRRQQPQLMARQKKDTQSIIEALEQGGLPHSEYSTVYAVLRRREKQVGDIINMKGDWALAEWYPNYRKKSTEEESDEKILEELDAENKDGKKTAKSA